MLVIYGNEEAFSPAGQKTIAGIVHGTDGLNQEPSGPGALTGAHGAAGHSALRWHAQSARPRL